MSIAASLRIRRTLTVIVAVFALLLGFAAIRAASAWTAEAAPLVASPATAAAIEARLSAEQTRSAELEVQIVALTTQTGDMAAALLVAQDRIATDADHADQLAKDLAAARKRLKKLEASIKAAAAQRRVTVIKTTPSNANAGSGSSDHDDEDERDDEHDDD